jgi:cytidylate kinase
MKPFVTLSASYGARGSEIGPAVAQRLEVPFFDRAISAQVADRLGMSVEDPLLHEQGPVGFFQRLLTGFNASALLLPIAGVPPDDLANLVDESTFRREIDRVIHAAGASPEGGVLLGRAGAVVLAEHPRALHVRLDGPATRRIQTIQNEQGIDEKQGAKQMRDNDAAREAYVKQLYGADAKDPNLYDLMIDSTRIATPACIELIALAANSRNRADPNLPEPPKG